MEDRTEDYFVLATLMANDAAVEGVPCKVYLPTTPLGKPELRFRPSRAQFRTLGMWPECSFAAIAPTLGTRRGDELASATVWLTEAVQRSWGQELTESHFTGMPQNFRVSVFTNDFQSNGRSTLVFWISPNKYLAPALVVHSDHKGDVSCKRVRPLLAFDVGPTQLHFDTHFFDARRAREGGSRGACLVATATEVCATATDTDDAYVRLLPAIDDFLLIASFAARTRTACVGWSATDDCAYTRFYRGFLARPDGAQVRTLNEGLIRQSDFPLFTEQAFAKFCSARMKSGVRGAIHALTDSRDRTVESTFLSTYAALEDLVREYRAQNGPSEVLDPISWRTLRSSMKKWIRGQTDVELTRTQRGHLYAKMPELNRVPAAAAFERMRDSYETDLRDLWPVFNGGKGVSLSEIRNLLIHGGFPAQRVPSALFTALEHLQWTVERILLGLLGWPVARSEVSHAFLATAAASMEGLSASRREVADAIRSI